MDQKQTKDKGAKEGPSTSNTAIAIPNFKEVRAVERRIVSPPILFQRSTADHNPPPPPQQQQQQHASTFSNTSSSQQKYQHQYQQKSTTMPPPPPPPPPQQQQQQLQLHTPSYNQHPNPPPLPQQQQQQQQQQHYQQLPNPNAILVNKRQEGNPVLKHIKNVRWIFTDTIAPDYQCGESTAVLFLSLRFHLLKPDYIHTRIKGLQRAYRLRVILCQIDSDDAAEPLAQVTRAAIGNDCTLLCAFNAQEAARYLEILKSCENRPAESIQKEVGRDYVSKLTAALTTVRGVNKTDVKVLGDAFGSVAAMFQAEADELLACPGVGPTKARRLYEAFNEPFRRTGTVMTMGSGGNSDGRKVEVREDVVEEEDGDDEEEGDLQ